MELAEVMLCMGCLHLFVAEVVLATEGDKCRDGDLPDEMYDPIPPQELESAWIGDKRAKDLDLKLVRFFCGNTWNEAMLRYVAEKINRAAREALAGKGEANV